MLKRFWWMFLVMLPVGSMVGLLVTAVITYVMPKKYESETMIELRAPAHSGNGVGSSRREAAQFHFETELEKVRSRNTLGRVVDTLELVNRWSVDKETAIRILKAIVVTQQIKGTDLVSIRVRHTNKVDARDIAMEVAQAYKSYRMETDTREQDSALYELTKEVRDQEDKVEERRKVVATIVRTKGIIPDEKPPAVTQSNGEAREEAVKRGLDLQDYVDAKRDFETDQEYLKTMKLKLLEMKLRHKMADSGVAIHDEAVIAESPISPNVSLNLTLGLLAGFLLSPLMALPVIWVMNRGKPVTG
jgi:uncharacterized protein involved in exopolysaccharide biosynthesis